MSDAKPDAVSFDQVYDLIVSRHSANPAESYVASLERKGLDAILKKIGEESSELLIAAKNGGRAEALHELADLWFHMMVWMAHAGHSLDDLRGELGARYGRSGLPTSNAHKKP
jgi:phosphoribosyl-ATP pyrophosphohydrolase